MYLHYHDYAGHNYYNKRFIECFTTTFLRAHSWLNWVDEDDDEHDEVGLKEKPEDTSKRLHRNKNRSVEQRT